MQYMQIGDRDAAFAANRGVANKPNLLLTTAEQLMMYGK